MASDPYIHNNKYSIFLPAYIKIYNTQKNNQKYIYFKSFIKINVLKEPMFFQFLLEYKIHLDIFLQK